MTSAARTSSSYPLAALAIVAAVGVWSCGGAHESLTAPAVAQVQADGGESGVVTASKVSKMTICHKGKDLSIPPSALGGHLGHGDKLGSCRATLCPCFSSSGLDTVAASCQQSLSASCPGSTPYAINLSCTPGGSAPPTGLGLFEARVESGLCSTTLEDPMSGGTVTVPMAVTAAKFEACRQAIVASSFYPAGCPK